MILQLHATRLLARRAIRAQIEAQGHHSGGHIKGWAEAQAWMHRRLPAPTPVADLITTRRLMAVAWRALEDHPGKGRWQGADAPEGLVHSALDLASRLRRNGHNLQGFHDRARRLDRPRCTLAADWLLAWERLMRQSRLTDRTGVMAEVVEGLAAKTLAWPAEYEAVRLHGFIACDPLMLRWMRALAGLGVALEWHGHYPIETAPMEADEERAFMDRLLSSADRRLKAIEDQFVEEEKVEVAIHELAINKTPSLFVAPDRYREMEEIGRRIRERLESGESHAGEMAVIMPSLAAYQELTADIFHRFRIPLYLRVGLPARNDAAMRWAESLVRWVAGGCPIEEWPALAQSPWMSPSLENHTWSALTPDWLPLLAQARAANGPALQHLDRLRDVAGSDPGRGALVGVLAAFVEILQSWPQTARAADHAKAALTVLARAGAFAGAAFDAPRRNAIEQSLERLLRVLRQCGEERRNLSRPEWLVAWQAALAESTLHRFPREEDAVSLLSFDEAAGLSFKHSYIAGLIEGDWPAAPDPNPLFTDGDALRFGDPKMALGRERADREAWLFALALDGAGQATLSHPTMDAEGRPTVASRFFEAARQRAGLKPGNVPKLKLSDTMPHPMRSAEPLEHFASLVAVAAGHRPVGDSTTIANRVTPDDDARWTRVQSLHAAQQRRDAFFLDDEAVPNEYAGQGPTATWITAQPVAAKSVEEMAVCGFQWAAHKALRLAPTEQPSEEPTPLEAGSWMHRALERLYAPWQGQGPVSVARLREQVEECVRAAWREKIGGDPNWPANAFLIGRMTAQIKAWTGVESEAGVFSVQAAEHSFGLDGHPALVLGEGENTIQIRGQIDRVDRMSDTGCLRVVEFKNSKSDDTYMPLMRSPGTRGFQLALYMLAAAREEGRTLSEGEIKGMYALIAKPLALITEKQGQERKSFWTGLESEEAFTASTLALVRRMARGEWTPRPYDGDGKICERCDVARLCRRVWVRPLEASAQSPDQSDSQ